MGVDPGGGEGDAIASSEGYALRMRQAVRRREIRIA
jgi:hypothetical protein